MYQLCYDFQYLMMYNVTLSPFCPMTHLDRRTTIGFATLLIFQEVSPGSEKLIGKTSSKSKAKTKANSRSKPYSLPRSSMQEFATSNSAPSIQFGLRGHTSIQTPSMTAFQSMPCQTPPDAPAIPNQVINSSGNINTVSYHNQTPYHMFPPQPANGFMPMIYWSAPNVFPPYNSTYGYHSFPSAANHIPIHHQPYFSHPSSCPLIPKKAENNKKNDLTLEEAQTGSDSDSSSTSTEPKVSLTSCK